MSGIEAKLLDRIVGGKIPVALSIANGIPPTFGGEAEPSWGRRLKSRSQSCLKSQLCGRSYRVMARRLVLQGHHPDEIRQEEEAESDVSSIMEASCQATSDSGWKDN